MVNMEDVRKTGPVGLKGINTQAAQEEAKPEKVSALYLGRTPQSYGMGVDLSFQSSTGDLGSSKFDENILTIEQIQDVENMRANKQTSIGKWANGITKGGILAGTTFLDGTLGLILGSVDALANIGNKEESGWETFSRLWDNEFSNGMATINEWSEKALPNYRTKEERDRAWYQNLGTANFWADTFLKNMGFTVGAFASGSAFTKLMKGAGLLKTGLGAATAGSIYGAINEARVEANHNSTDFYKKEQQLVEQSYKQEYDTILADRFASDFEKQENLEKLNAKYQAIQENLDVRKSKMGLGTFIGNAVFLSINDFFTMGRLYAQGFHRARSTGKGLAATADDLFASDQSISKYVTKQGDKWVADNISTASAVGRGFTKGLLEGNEEMAQRFISGTFGERYDVDSPDAYFNAVLDSDAIIQTDKFLDALVAGFKDSYGNGDAYEEFAVGFLTGFLGIPTFGKSANASAATTLGRGKSIGLSGGLWGEISMAKAANKEMNEAVAFMNKYEQKLKTNKEHFVRSQAFTNAMSGWSEANDAFEYKNMEDNDDFVAISRYAAMGKLDYLKALVNQDFENISDETLQAMARETSTDTSGWYNVDGTYTPDGEEGAAKMRKELVKKRDQILTQIANYETAVRETRVIANDGLTEDQINELAWLHWKGSRFKERYTQMRKEFPTFYRALSDNLADWEKALEEVEEAGLSEDNTKDLKYTVSLLKTFIDKINSEEDLMSLAYYLKANKKFLEFINSQNFYDTFAEHQTLSIADYQKTINNLKDIARVASAYKTFNDRYKEFVENPTKLRNRRERVKTKKEVSKQSVEKNEAVSKIEELSQNEILRKIQEGELDLEELKEVVGLEGVDIEEVAETEAARKIQEVAQMVSTMEEAKEEAVRMYQKGDLDDQGLRDVIALIEASGISAEGIDQVLDMDLEVALDPDTLEDTDIESILPDPERILEKEERLDKARGSINFISSTIKSRKQGLTEQPSPSSEPKETGHDSSPTAETIQEAEARRKAQAARGKDLKELLEKVEELVTSEDRIPVKDAVIRMYDAAKSLFENGLSFKEILETLHKFPQYETAKKYPKVLQLVKDFVEGLFNPKENIPLAEITLDDIAEQEVVVSEDENVEAQNKEIKNQKSNDNASGYWQPSTTQFPIYRQDGSRVPFHEVAKGLKKEDGSPRYTEAQLNRMKAVYEYLESKGTFALRNSSALAVKDDVHFVIDPTLNQEVNDIVILMANSKGQIIGDVVDTTYESAAEHANLIETVNAIKQEYAEWVNAGNTGVFTSQKYKSKIAQLMVGRVEYSEGRHSLNEIFTVTTSIGETKQLPFKIAVAVAEKAGKLLFTTTSESGGLKGVDPVGELVMPPLKAKKGQPFLLIPTNSPTKRRGFMPVSFAMPTYDRGTEKSTLGTIIDGILKDILTIDSKAAAVSVSKRLAEHLGKAWKEDDGKLKTSFHINRSSRYIELASDAELRSGISRKEQRTIIKINYVPKKGEKAVFEIEIDPTDPDAINKLKTEMFRHQIPFRINRKYLNKKIGNLDYNTVIGELANTNVEPGYITTTNNWFTIAPVSPDGTIQKAEKLESTGINPTSPVSQPTTPTKTAVEYNGKTLFVDEQWNVTDETGKSYNRGENTLKFLGYAWGIIKGEDMTKPYNTEWGIYDPIKKNYIPKVQSETITQPAVIAIPRGVESSIFDTVVKDGVSITKIKQYRNGKQITLPYGIGIDLALIEEASLPEGFVGNVFVSEFRSDGTKHAATVTFVPLDKDEAPYRGEVSVKQDITKYIQGITTESNFNVDTVEESITEESGVETKPELVAKLKAKGLLNTPKRQKMVEYLSEEQLAKVLENKDVLAKQIIQKLELSFNIRTGTFTKDPNSIITTERNREAVGKYKTFDRDSELKWLESVLPQYKDRVQLVEGLIKIANGVNSDRAFGKFVNGHIVLSDIAAEGTVYHEAFHAVVNTLLNESELLDLLNEGKKQFGLTDDIAVEEKLAEGFRRYIQIEQGFGGSIVKAFRRIRHYMRSIRGKESVIHKLYFDISQGYYADKKLYETEVSRNREINLDNFSLEELKELKSYLDSKQYQEIHPNRTAVVDYVMSNPMLKKAFELGLLKDVKHRKDRDARRIVPKTTELNKLIRAKRKGATAYVVDITTDMEGSVYRPNLTREQQISEAALAWQERDLDYFDEIADYHTYKLNYNYLSLEDKQYVDSTGISEEQWNKLQNKVKEAILHCK